MKKACILIPYYNSGNALIESINSIDHKKYIPDIIIVDDGSTNIPAKDVIPEYAGPLPITLIELTPNQGIEHALNKGLTRHGRSYQYIFRLDCGDLCKNDRIAKQIDYLEKNKNIDLLGSWVDFVDMKGKHAFTLRHPASMRDISRRMYINTTFTHPSVVLRSKILDSVGYYPTNTPAAEDYSYFFSIIKKHNASNIQESLVDCTIDPFGISTIKRKRQIKSRIKTIIKHFNFSPHSFYGLARSVLLLFTPRSFTVTLNKFLRK